MGQRPDKLNKIAMNHKNFSNCVNELIPSIEEFVKLGHPKIFSELIMKKLFLRPKKNQTSYNNEIVALIYNFECVNFDLRGITLMDKTLVSKQYQTFGKFDDFDLSLSRETAQIFMTDQAGHVICECAEDADCFLDSLFLLADYTIKSIKMEIEDTNETKALLAKRAALMSKKPQSLRFYKLVLGVRD